MVNFFSWLRDGVKQSVLLGVSDAVEQLGAPSEEELHPSVAGFLKTDGSAAASPRLTGSGTKTTRGRKRLGKSLKDIDVDKKS
ncbi:MAG: hypothetical protein VXZ82_10410 [Planctomycetota bacterium]|nr:hypothetical protein [Planctomycetota bacterium]